VGDSLLCGGEDLLRAAGGARQAQSRWQQGRGVGEAAGPTRSIPHDAEKAQPTKATHRGSPLQSTLGATETGNSN